MRRRQNGKIREPQPGGSRAAAAAGHGSLPPATAAGNDMANVPVSGNAAAVFLDRRLCVRRFTPAVTKLLSVSDSDVGRPMSEIVRRFNDDALLDDARRVLAGRVPASAEVRAEDGGSYLRRILPYRSNDGGVEGVVITFTDATDLRALTEALRVSEAQARWLERFPGENPNPVLRISADGTVLYQNPAAEASPAWRCESGQLLQEDLHRLIAKALADGKPAEYDLELGGTPYAVSIAPVLAEGCVNIYARDITARKRAEDALRDSQQQNQFLADVLHHASHPFAVGYPDGRIGLHNRAFVELTGYTSEELRRLDWSTVLTAPEWRAAEQARLEELNRTGKPVRYEKECVRKDGSRVPIELLVHVVRDSSGKPDYYYTFLSDITERQMAQRRLEDLARQRQLALDAAKLGWWQYDPVTQVAEWDDGYGAIFGVTGYTRSNEEILRQIIHPDDLPALWAKVEAALNPIDPQPFVTEYRINRPDGRLRWVRAHGLATFEGEGDARRAVSLVGTVEDITERKQIEAEQLGLAAAIQQERDRLSALINGMTDEIWFADADKRVTLVNPAVWREFGAGLGDANEVEKIAGSFEVYRGDGTPRPVEEAPPLRALRGETVINEEEIVRTPATGALRHRQVNAAPVRGPDGSIVGSVSVVRDITERKRAEEALRESEEKLRSSFANAAIGFAITTPDGRFVDANPAYCRLTGYELAELTATEFPQLIHPEDHAANMELIRRMLAGELPGFVVENRYVRKGGATVDVRKSVAVVRASDGTPRWIIALVEDITERKQAEEALRQSEERFRVMFEGHGAPMLLIEPDSGQITDANEAAARFYKYSREQLKTMRIDQINQLPAEEVAAERRKALELGKNLFVFPHRLASGEVRWVEVYSSPVTIQSVPMLFSIVHDITARRQAEEALTQRTAELARSNEDLQQFAYASSHDLQEPLRMVSGFLKLLEDRHGPLLDDKARQYIGFAVEGATRMSQLIRDLLDFSRVERQGGPIEPTDPNQALKEALANLLSAAQEAGASITSDELPTVLADRSQLMLLFQNLIGNAVKFRSADRPCRVHVGVRRRDDRWEFSVRDNGIGIPADSFDRIFALFQRLHTREKYAGTGLGLAICKKIVERHGGRIWVESQVGEGATFLFTLPVVQ